MLLLDEARKCVGSGNGAGFRFAKILGRNIWRIVDSFVGNAVSERWCQNNDVVMRPQGQSEKERRNDHCTGPPVA